MNMLKEYNLKDGGLHVSFYSNAPEMIPLNYNELYKWLKSNSSDNIKAFNHWYYLVNDTEFHFKLERADNHTWNVYELEIPDKVFFSFINFEGLKFKQDFERELKSILSKKGF